VVGDADRELLWLHFAQHEMAIANAEPLTGALGVQQVVGREATEGSGLHGDLVHDVLPLRRVLLVWVRLLGHLAPSPKSVEETSDNFFDRPQRVLGA